MEKPPVRHLFDPKTGKDYFSIADVVGYVTDTVDARNYWKVLKNRLKKSSPELVTKCNQLKMVSKDGKYYLTDVADAETILQIAEVVPGANIAVLNDCLRSPEETENPLSTRQDLEKEESEMQLLVDVYQKDVFIFIEAMVAGVLLENISISVFPKKVIISGKRSNEDFKSSPEDSQKEYLRQELLWTNFSRTILLPHKIQIDKVEKIQEHGRLIIKLLKTDNSPPNS